MKGESRQAKAQRSGGGRARPRIGVMVPGNIELGRGILRGVAAYCREAGAELEVVTTTGRMADDLSYLERLGCLVGHVYNGEEAALLAGKCGNLVVTTNRHRLADHARVVNDDLAVGRMGAEFLLGRGFRRLVFAGAESEAGGEFAFSLERGEGFAERAREAGVEVERESLGRAKDGAVVMEKLLGGKLPVAVMAASDLHARWLAEGIGEPQRWIPSRLVLVGVDDDPLEQALSPVGITSVRLAGEQVGYGAAQLGMRLRSGEAVAGEPVRVAPVMVVGRESTGTFAVEDPLVRKVLGLMAERLSELGDANEVAALAKVPRRTLEWRFKRALGSTVAQELKRERMQGAFRLLASTELSVKEIAYLLGYSEPRMLSLVFKRETGERPLEYRSRVRLGMR